MYASEKLEDDLYLKVKSIFDRFFISMMMIAIIGSFVGYKLGYADAKAKYETKGVTNVKTNK